jgi:hypothetical protein
MNAGLKIKRRDDLIPSAIALKFRVTGTWNGNQYTQVISDIASTIGGTVVEGVGLAGQLDTIQSFATGTPALVGGSANSATMQALEAAGRDFSASIQTIDMQGNSSNATYCTIVTVPVNLSTPAGGGSALAFWQAVFPELPNIASPDFYNPGSGAITPTVVDDNGNDLTGNINAGIGYNYLLTQGQVAHWMLSGNETGGNPAQFVRAHISAQFTGTQKNQGAAIAHIQAQPKQAVVFLITIPGGTYINQQITPGEIIPYGLAGYIYNIESIPQYEGTFIIQETEVTDQCPLGNNLNITGSLAEWATMQACIQQINYDLVAGRTSLNFGPAAHLGAKDFVERLRINRGPRWFNLNGNNVQNAPNQNGGSQLGQGTSQLNPTHSEPGTDVQINPISLADLAANSYSFGTPGITHDTRHVASGSPLQPNYGSITGLSAPNAPTVFLAAGSGGALGGLIRISVADLIGANKQAWFQPVSVQVTVDGECVTKTMYLLGTAPE